MTIKLPKIRTKTTLSPVLEKNANRMRKLTQAEQDRKAPPPTPYTTEGR